MAYVPGRGSPVIIKQVAPRSLNRIRNTAFCKKNRIRSENPIRNVSILYSWEPPEPRDINARRVSEVLLHATAQEGGTLVDSCLHVYKYSDCITRGGYLTAVFRKFCVQWGLWLKRLRLSAYRNKLCLLALLYFVSGN